MKRALLVLTVLLTQACSTGGVGPSPLYSSYFLSQVDGKLLPVPYASDGTLLLAGSLGFGVEGRPRGQEPEDGTVSYTLLVRQPGQSEQLSTVQLDYSIRDGELRINLCPPLALCLVSSELVGPILGRTEELVLTHYLAGNPGSVYRYFPSLPD